MQDWDTSSLTRPSAWLEISPQEIRRIQIQISSSSPKRAELVRAPIPELHPQHGLDADWHWVLPSVSYPGLLCAFVCGLLDLQFP